MRRFTSGEVEQELRRAMQAGDDGYVQHLQGLLGDARERERSETVLKDMSAGERFLAGMGRGMLHVGQHVPGLNRVLPKEDVDGASATALTDTTAGGVGNIAGEIAATAPAGMVVGAAAAPVAAAARGAGLAARATRFALPLAAEGGAIGGLMSDEEGVGGKLKDAAVGAGLGVGVGYGMKKAGDALRRAVRLGGSAPTAEAEALMREGIQVTPGQARPTGVMNQIEESMQSFPLVGPSIQNSRDTAVAKFRDVALRKAAPDGFVPTAGAPVQNQVDEIAKAFGPAYDVAKGFDVFGVAPRGRSSIPFDTRTVRIGNRNITKVGAFDEAVFDPGTLASRDEQRAAKRFLDSQLGILKGANKGGDLVSSDALLQVRSNVREKVREALQAGETKVANILKRAEGDLTAAVDAGVPTKVAQQLKRTDTQYAKFADVYEAAAKALSNDGNFSAKQLVTAAGKGTSTLQKAKGHTGDMGDWGALGAKVFEQRSPPTGARLMTLLIGGAQKIPFVNALPALTADLAAKPGVARLVTGNTKLQRAALKGIGKAEGSKGYAAIRSAAVRGAAAEASDD